MKTLTSILIVTALATPAKAGYFHYFCPKGNVDLLASENKLEGRAVEPFPIRPGLNGRQSEGFSWQLTDCSNAQFLCYDANNWYPARRIFVPRHPKVGATYRYGEATAYVTGAAMPDRPPTVQIIISQKHGAWQGAIKLTLQTYRGVIFIDGLNFWRPDDFSSGETCALTSKTGYFKEVLVPFVRLGQIE